MSRGPWTDASRFGVSGLSGGNAVRNFRCVNSVLILVLILILILVLVLVLVLRYLKWLVLGMASLHGEEDFMLGPKCDHFSRLSNTSRSTFSVSMSTLLQTRNKAILAIQIPDEGEGIIY